MGKTLLILTLFINTLCFNAHDFFHSNQDNFQTRAIATVKNDSEIIQQEKPKPEESIALKKKQSKTTLTVKS